MEINGHMNGHGMPPADDGIRMDDGLTDAERRLIGLVAGVQEAYMRHLLHEIRAMLDDALGDVGASVSERIEVRLDELAEGRLPVLVSMSDLMRITGRHDSTIREWLRRYDIPARSLGGDLWREGDGQKLYALAEFQQRRRLHTRSIKHDVRRARGITR